MADIKLPAAWQDWQITDEIGEGAYGRVYRAEKENGGVKAVRQEQGQLLPARNTVSGR